MVCFVAIGVDLILYVLFWCEQSNVLIVSNAGFGEINGSYTEIDKDVYEMRRNENNRIYRIELETSTPFGNYAWTINRVDGFNNICIYANTLSKDIKDLQSSKKGWCSVVGDEPFPNIQFVQV